MKSIQASSQTQDQKVTSLENFQKENEQFITDVVETDNRVADVINARKNEFYKEHSWLKPDCEKSNWEKFKDGCKDAWDWCKDNWELALKIVLAIAIIAIATVTGSWTIILPAILKGALSGALMGGFMSLLTGGSFLEGMLKGMLNGALFGGIFGLGAAFGKTIKCIESVGKIIKTISKVSKVLFVGTLTLDIAAFGWGLFDPNNPLMRLQNNNAYKLFKLGNSIVMAFTTGATSTMKCFVAGTMILTARGLMSIEDIQAGDKVISTSEEDFKVKEKRVVETYIRETRELIHLIINGEKVSTTYTHPFYVKERGFVEAGELEVGEELYDAKGNVLYVEETKRELLNEPVKVYNFQVEDYHTYHVGNNGILVHNAGDGYTGENPGKSAVDHASKDHDPNAYAKQLRYKPKEFVLKELEYKSFFNKDWSSSQIRDALNYGFKEALKNNFTDGKYNFSFNGENITIALKNGALKSGWGSYKYTFEELLSFLK